MLSHQPTLKEIARELQISISTVSRALQNHPSIGHRTRERVHELADQKGYVPNTAAIGLRTHRKQLVGVVVPAISPSYVADWVSETTQSFFDRGYLTVLCQSAQSQEQLIIRALLSHRVDGVLLFGAEATTSLMMSELMDKAMPVICVDLPPSQIISQQATDSLLALIEG